ncbi:MAG TPA: hypothetical protein VH917_03480 [Ignavibacteriaceae bacterium]
MKAIPLSIPFLFLLLILSNNSHPQQSNLSQKVNYISQFIASESFINLKKTNNDLSLVDSIYSRAVNINSQDKSEALLALTFSSIPYKQIPILIPLTGIKIYYPLTSAEDSIFKEKNKNLPKYFFYDSPSGDYGDKDKLAHFFGNAFISYSEDILDLSFLIGYFVEAFEEDFILDSEFSLRDVDVNWYGEIFGSMLKQNKKILPSNILLLRSFRYIIIIL